MTGAQPGPVDLTTRPETDVLAAGAVLWRPGRGGPAEPEVAVVHRPRYDDWSLPKGKLDRGESLPAAAVREVAEETGCTARLEAWLGDVHYAVPEGRKAVRFWAAEAVEPARVFVPNAETDVLRWLPIRAAAEVLSYRRELEVLRRFARMGAATSVLLMVRHAKAGSRAQWDGSDDARPLSGTGRDQAARLAELLPLFGPDRIRSASPVRCRDTVAPLAAAVADRIENASDGRAVGDEPLLGEEGYRDDPDGGRARLRALARLPGVTVVCSQGGVIPDAMRDLVHAAGVPSPIDLDAVPSRKASTWVLTLHDGALVAADYFSRPTG